MRSKKGFTLVEYVVVICTILFLAVILSAIWNSSQEHQREHDAKWRVLKAQMEREAAAESAILEKLRHANAAGESTVVTMDTGGGRFAMAQSQEAALRRHFEKDHPDRVVTDMKVGRYGIWWVLTRPAGESQPAEVESSTPSQ